jgi:hypothetical protein
MENVVLRSTDEALAAMHGALDTIDHAARARDSDERRQENLRSVLHLAGRVQSLFELLAAENEASEACARLTGVPVASWLAATERLTRRAAARVVQQGVETNRFPELQTASLEGAVRPAQVTAITSVLSELPENVSAEQVTWAEKTLIGYAGQFDATELRRLSSRVFELVAPTAADDLEAARVEREYEHARRQRFLSFAREAGSIRISGSLPIVDGLAFQRLVDAHVAQARRSMDELPGSSRRTLGMRRADGLCALVDQALRSGTAPVDGGERPRLAITMTYDDLLDHARRANLIGAGQTLPAGVLRQLACDAQILPVVLGAPSQVLDVGRSQRLVTTALRQALEIRDGGCVFPGCDRPPHACHAHHIEPWWSGGTTSLNNLTLLCPHHHGIVEPSHDPRADRWRVQLRSDGVPEVIAPHRIDPEGRSRGAIQTQPTFPPSASTEACQPRRRSQASAHLHPRRPTFTLNVHAERRIVMRPQI